MSEIFASLAQLYTENPVAQIFGCIAIILGCASYQGRTPRQILYLQSAGSCFWALHFFLIGAPMGGFLNAFSIPRNLIYSRRGKDQWADSLLWPIAFTLIFVCAAACSFFILKEGWVCLISLSAQTLGNFALRITNAQLLRIYSVIISLLWLTYNILSCSIPAVICETLNQFSLYIALFRYRRQDRHS